MQKRGAEDDGYDESQPNKRSKNEESTELAVLQQTSSALTVKSDQVCLCIIIIYIEFCTCNNCPSNCIIFNRCALQAGSPHIQSAGA